MPDNSAELKIFLDKYIFRLYITGMTMPPQTAVNFVGEAASASVMLNPLRLQILERLREPDSASGLSRQMNLPRQKLNYHLRALEKHGLIEQVEERKRGNCVERIVRATARHYLISPEALGNLATGPSQIQERFSSAYLVAVAARAIHDLAVLRTRAARAGKQLATFTLETSVKLASAAELNAFAEELTKAVARLAAKYHDERARRGRTFKFIIGSYPAITKNEENLTKEASHAGNKTATENPRAPRRSRN
jgi:DNA-binding transcriptional ArsR family regulator